MFDLWLEALLDASLKGLFLCLAAGAAVLALRRASAAARHLVWRLAFVGLLALPALAAVLPLWRVPLPGLMAVSPAPEPVRQKQAQAPLPVSSASFQVPAPTVSAAASSGELGSAQAGGLAISWRTAALAIWLAGALAMLGSLAVALARVRWQRRHARLITDEAWTGLLDRVCTDLGITRPVELLAGGEQAMPMTWGWRRPAVLLPASAESWPEPRRRAVLLHELAHVARGDYLTQLAAEVARSLYWFNPLVWRAARRLRLESEHACDDRVLAAGTRASDYAGELLDIARSLRAVRAVAPAGLAMARPSELTGRLLAVLDGERNRRCISRRFTLPAWLATACLVIPLAALTPALSPAAEPAADEKPARSIFKRDGRTLSIDVNSEQGYQDLQWSDGGRKIRIRTEGQIDLTDDWTGIASLSPGATVRIEEEGRGVERRLDITAGSGGQPVYTWKVAGRERAFDAEARQWLQGMLLDLVRGTGYEADERVAYFLNRQGPEGVLAEISQIPSGYVKRIYFQKLFARRELAPALVERAIRQAGREIEAGYDLHQTLTAAAESQEMTAPIALAYAEAAGSIDSDHERRITLAALIDKGRLDSRSLAAVLRATRGMESDHDLRLVLTSVAGESALDEDELQRAYVEAASSIESSHDRRQALSAVVKRDDLSEEALLAVLRAARGIDSSHDCASVLVELAGRHTLSGAAREAYLEAASSISSGYDRERAEAALGRRRSGR